MDNQDVSKEVLKGKKIVSVEDDKFLNDIIARKFASTGCTLVTTSNGEEAVGLIEKEMPDIVLLDILLPGMDGFEILRLVKANPKTKDIPVILLSNLGSKADMERGKTLGAAKFLIKATVTMDEVIDEIKKLIG